MVLSQECKAFYSVNCINVYWCQYLMLYYTFALLSVLNWARTGSFTQSLSASDLGFGLCCVSKLENRCIWTRLAT
jgi:hypothetical protein